MRSKSGLTLVDRARKYGNSYQIKLNISSATQLLPSFVGLCERHVLSTLDYREVLIKETGATVLDKGEEFLGVLVVQIVKEDPANSARLSSVSVHEINVTPLFEFWVVAFVMLVTSRLEDSVKVFCVFFKEIGWGLL